MMHYYVLFFETYLLEFCVCLFFFITHVNLKLRVNVSNFIQEKYTKTHSNLILQDIYDESLLNYSTIFITSKCLRCGY